MDEGQKEETKTVANICHFYQKKLRKTEGKSKKRKLRVTREHHEVKIGQREKVKKQ